MTSSGNSNSGPYKCPGITCGKTFGQLKNFFGVVHWKEHEKRCPLVDCSKSYEKPYGFEKHWMTQSTHLEVFGISEPLVVCENCGESYNRYDKSNHNRKCARPKSNKRRRDEAENGSATSIFNVSPGVSNESYGDTLSVARIGHFEPLQTSVSQDNISRALEPGLARHDNEPGVTQSGTFVCL